MAQEAEVGRVRLRAWMQPGNQGRGLLADQRKQGWVGESVGAVLCAFVG